MSEIVNEIIEQLLGIIRKSSEYDNPWYQLKIIVSSEPIELSIEDYLRYFFMPRQVPFLNRVFGSGVAGEFNSDWQDDDNSKAIIAKLSLLKPKIQENGMVYKVGNRSYLSKVKLKKLLEKVISDFPYKLGERKGSSISIHIDEKLSLILAIEGLSKIENGISTFDAYLVNGPLEKGIENIRANYSASVHLNADLPFKLHRTPSILFSFTNQSEFEEKIRGLLKYVIPSLQELSWYENL